MTSNLTPSVTTSLELLLRNNKNASQRNNDSNFKTGLDHANHLSTSDKSTISLTKLPEYTTIVKRDTTSQNVSLPFYLSTAKSITDILFPSSTTSDVKRETPRSRSQESMVTRTYENLLNTSPSSSVKDLPEKNETSGSTISTTKLLPNNWNDINETKSSDILSTTLPSTQDIIHTSSEEYQDVNETIYTSQRPFTTTSEKVELEGLTTSNSSEKIPNDEFVSKLTTTEISSTELPTRKVTSSETADITLSSAKHNSPDTTKSTPSVYPPNSEPNPTNQTNEVGSTLVPTENFLTNYTDIAKIPMAIVVVVAIICVLTAFFLVLALIFYCRQRSQLTIISNSDSTEEAPKMFRSKTNNHLEKIENGDKVEQSHHFINEAFTDDDQPLPKEI
ncbi:hypothetical protein Ahia01_000866100 [Argonauta hians]